MTLDNAQANAMLAYMHGGGAPRAVTGSALRLLTAVGTDTANGTEVATGGGYTAGTGLSLAWAAAAAKSQATSGVSQVTNYPRAETVNGVEVWSTTSPVRVEYGALTGGGKLMAAGDTLSFAAGAITSALN